MATDVNADLFTEIESGTERVSALVSEGNTEGAAELAVEIEGMISSIKGRSAELVGKRKTYRAALAEAQKPLATEVEVKAKAAAPAEVLEGEGVAELVKMGAERVRSVTIGKIKGGYEIAEILFDIRRRIILPDGTPDLNARSQHAKNRSAEVYDIVIASLPAEGESEEGDSVRNEITSIKRSAQDAITDVKVKHALALDSTEGAELEPYAAILKDGVKPSEALSAHYGFKLKTRRELEAERRAAKALTTGDDGDIRKVAASIKRAVKTTESVNPSAVSELNEKERDSLKLDIKAQIAALNALLAQLA